MAARRGQPLALPGEKSELLRTKYEEHMDPSMITKNKHEEENLTKNYRKK